MGRIERVSSTQPVPVRQAQLIDPGAFRLNAASAEELEVIGGVLSELGERKQRSDDSLSINSASEARDLAKLQLDNIIKLEPDPDKWAEQWSKVKVDLAVGRSKLRFSSQAKENDDIEQILKQKRSFNMLFGFFSKSRLRLKKIPSSGTGRTCLRFKWATTFFSEKFLLKKFLTFTKGK